METQVKQRLTGAIILVGLVVLLVPELLTGPRRHTPPPETESSTVAEEQRLRAYTVKLAEQPRHPHAVSRTGVEEPSVPEPARPVTSAESPTPQAEPARPPEPVSPPATAPAPSTAPPAVSIERQQPAPRPTTQPAASSPSAEPKTPPRTPEKAPSTAGWAIQVGSFANRKNADALVGKLKDQGFAAFVVEGTNSGRKFYRVRVGPEAERADAQKLVPKLRAAGHSGTLVPHP